LALALFQDAAFPEREHRFLLKGPLSHKADIVEFHGKPGERSFCPDLELKYRNFKFCHGGKFFSHLTFELRPPHIFPSAYGVADDIGIMRHEASERLDVLLGVGANQRADGRLRIGRFMGKAGRPWLGHYEEGNSKQCASKYAGHDHLFVVDGVAGYTGGLTLSMTKEGIA
jgi:hypothetical protein